MDLYNVKTRQKEAISDPEALQAAILSGSHSFPSGVKIPVFEPESDERKYVPAENVRKAIEQGYRVLTPAQNVVQDHIEENKGFSGSVKVAAKSFANQALLDLPDLIYRKTGDPMEVAKYQALKKEHGLANVLGGVPGFGLSLLTGAPLWKAAAKTGEKVSEHLAARLAIEAGAEGSKRGFGQAAKEIAARMGSSAAEGAVVMAPHAITETMLGDPMEAAQTLLAGIGIGTVFGAGIGLGKEALGLGKKVKDASAKIMAEYGSTKEAVARKVAQSMTGVPEKDILFYLEKREALAANPSLAPEFEDLRLSIDDFVRSKAQNVQLSELALKEKTEEAKRAYSNALRDLEQSRAPLELGAEVNNAMVGQKPVMGELSALADSKLNDIKGVLPKKDMIRFVHIVDEKLFPKKIGKKVKRASGDLNAIAEDIEREFGKSITFPEVRYILQKVRKDIDFDKMASEFNDESNIALKTFTKSLSDLLKKFSPEYADLMTQIEKRADALKKMNRFFGDGEKTLHSINKVAKGDEFYTKIFNEFGEITGHDFSASMDALKNSKNLLELSKRKPIEVEEKLIPGLVEERNKLMNQAAAAKEEYLPISRLTTDRIQAAIQNMGHKKPNISTREAFEALERQSGIPYLDQIRFRNVLDAFNKAAPMGSKKAVTGAVTGSALFNLLGIPGGPGIGAAFGAHAGGLFDVNGGQFLKAMLDKNPNVAGLLFVEKAMKKVKDEIDSIPNILQRISAGTEEIAPKRTIALDAVMRFLHDDGETIDYKKAGEKLANLTDKMAQYLADPNAMEKGLSPLTTALSDGGAPKIAEGLTLGARNAIEYLFKEVPKQNSPASPFSKPQAWRPSDTDINRFSQRLLVANDPLIVIKALEDGSLTQPMMETLQEIYPVVYQAIQAKIMEAAADQKTPLNYSARLKLSLLAGTDLDRSLAGNSLLFLQNAFKATPTPQAEQQQQSGGSKDKPNSSANIKLPQLNQTRLQSATNK